LLQMSVNRDARTLALPFNNRLQSTQVPTNFYSLDQVSHVHHSMVGLSVTYSEHCL